MSDQKRDLLRAIRALGELDTYQYHRLEELYKRDSVIGYLNLRIAELEAAIHERETALEAANARARELGAIPPTSDKIGAASPQEVTNERSDPD